MPVVTPPFRVVSTGNQVGFWVRVLNVWYLRLYSRYKRLPKVLRGTVGKAIIAFLAVLVGVKLILEIWGKDDRRETSLFYQSWLTSVRLFTAGLITFKIELGQFATWINAKTNAVERHVNQVRTEVETVVKPQIRGVNAEVDALRDRTENPQTGNVPRLDARITQLRDYLLQPGTGILVRLGAQVDSLWADMYNPAIGKIALLTQDVVAIRTALFHPTQGVIPYLETEVGRIDLAQQKTDEWVTPVAAVATGVAVATALPTLLENVPKLRAQCRWDLDDIEQLLDQLLLLPSLAVLLLVAKEGAGAMGEISDEIRSAF